jgi:hypothetical protein
MALSAPIGQHVVAAEIGLGRVRHQEACISTPACIKGIGLGVADVAVDPGCREIARKSRARGPAWRWRFPGRQERRRAVAMFHERLGRHAPAFDVVDADHMDMGRWSCSARRNGPPARPHRETPRQSWAAGSRRPRSRRRPSIAAASARNFAGSVSSTEIDQKRPQATLLKPRVNRSNTSRNIGLWKLLEIRPISFVRPVVSDEASAFGL